MRQYLIGSWSNADEYDYSGEQLMGNRLGASREVPHFLANGRANVGKYGDNVAKTTKVPLKQRILPQAARVEKLHAEILELESAYKSGEFSLAEYTLLREVAFKKYNRAQELLKRAVKPVEKEEDEGISSYASSFPPSDNNGHGESYLSPVGGSFFAEVIDELSDTNSLKSFLKMSCKVVRKAVQFSQATRNYIKTLSEV